jgi:SNF2 family DNA or RNA helicase
MFTKNSPDQIQNYDAMVSKAKRLIAPFVLRRKKTEVLVHLPSKTIHLVHCPLPENQRILFASIFFA